MNDCNHIWQERSDRGRTAVNCARCQVCAPSVMSLIKERDQLEATIQRLERAIATDEAWINPTTGKVYALVPIERLAAPSDEVKRANVAWLIERDGLCYAHDDHGCDWVDFSDARAWHFTNKDTARLVIKTTSGMSGAFVAEHMWCAGPMQQSNDTAAIARRHANGGA